MLVDTHCHLNLLDANTQSIDQYIKNAEEKGVEHILNVSVNLKDFPVVLKTAEKYANVSASLGLHPNEKDENLSLDYLLKLGAHPKVIAFGETGLDYFRSEGDLSWQREHFRIHIAAAKTLKKPLIVHTRNAKADTIELLRQEHAQEIGGVMHCFTEDWETAKAALDLNFYISFSGIVTFKNAETIQNVAKKVPLDRILIETDAPYLAPVPYRGKANEPAYVYYTAQYLAELRGVTLEAFAKQSTENFYTLFKGAKPHHV